MRYLSGTSGAPVTGRERAKESRRRTGLTACADADERKGSRLPPLSWFSGYRR